MKENLPLSGAAAESSHQTSAAPWSRRWSDDEEEEEEEDDGASSTPPPPANRRRKRDSVPPATLPRHPSTFSHASSSDDEGDGQGKGERGRRGGERGRAEEGTVAAAVSLADAGVAGPRTGDGDGDDDDGGATSSSSSSSSSIPSFSTPPLALLVLFLLSAKTTSLKFARSFSPCDVATDSGWNCTPNSGSAECSSAISTREGGSGPFSSPVPSSPFCR